MEKPIKIEVDAEYAEEIAHLLRFAITHQATSNYAWINLNAVANILHPRDLSAVELFIYQLLEDNNHPITPEERKRLIDRYRNMTKELTGYDETANES